MCTRVRACAHAVVRVSGGEEDDLLESVPCVGPGHPAQVVKFSDNYLSQLHRHVNHGGDTAREITRPFSCINNISTAAKLRLPLKVNGIDEFGTLKSYQEQQTNLEPF